MADKKDIAPDEIALAMAAYDIIPRPDDDVLWDDVSFGILNQILVNGPKNISPDRRLHIMSSALIARMMDSGREDFHPLNIYGAILSEIISSAMALAFWEADGDRDTDFPEWMG